MNRKNDEIVGNTTDIQQDYRAAKMSLKFTKAKVQFKKATPKKFRINKGIKTRKPCVFTPI